MISTKPLDDFTTLVLTQCTLKALPGLAHGGIETGPVHFGSKALAWKKNMWLTSNMYLYFFSCVYTQQCLLCCFREGKSLDIKDLTQRVELGGCKLRKTNHKSC